MKVFVHGVPETAALWRKVRSAVVDGSVALSLPGFGTPRPDGFGATMDEYADWLLAQLGELDGPIDLVGHDWGGALTYRLASAHGDVIRSWVADVAGLAHPTYEWHDFAKIWQTPGEGEAFIESQDLQPVEERAAGFEALFGLSHDDAVEMASDSDLVMGRCILDLYRSALPNPHARWGPWTPTSAPGLVLHASDDPFGDERLARESAAMFGAQFVVLDGASHFWPYQVPELAAAVLQEFWASLPD